MSFSPIPVLGAVAPPAAALVRDFVNSVEWQEDDETWQSPADLEAWFAGRAGIPVSGLPCVRSGDRAADSGGTAVGAADACGARAARGIHR